MAKIYKSVADFEKFLKKQGQESFLSGDYFGTEADSFISEEARSTLKELHKAAIENGRTTGKLLENIEHKLNERGYQVQIIDNGDNEYSLAVIDNAKEPKLDAKEILESINIPKFRFATPKEQGMIKHSSQSEINQRVMTMLKNGQQIAYTRTEHVLEQINDALDRKNSGLSKALADRNGRKAAGSMRWISNQAMKKTPAVGGFRDNDDLWKALQGTGSKQNLMIRKNYIDIEPIIDNIVKQSKGLIKDYRRQNNVRGKNNVNFGSTFERTKSYIKQDIMQILAQYAMSAEIDAIEQNIKNNDAYKYLMSNEFAREVIKDFGKKVHSMNSYIGTSQENSINNFMLSLLPNAALGVLGGLDEKSSRKRVQVSNILSYNKVAAASKNARNKHSFKGVAFTNEQKKMGGISGKDAEQALFGIMYATNDEIQKAQKQLFKDLKKTKGVKNAATMAGLGTGAHSGGVFYSKDIERAFDATQARSKNLLEADIAKEIARIQGKMKGKNASDIRTSAIKNLLANEIGGNAADIILNSKKGVERLINGQTSFDFDFYEKRNMASGHKILTGTDYDRLTATAVSRALFKNILMGRGVDEKTAEAYLSNNKVGLLKQVDKVNYRNVSGLAESYMTKLLQEASTRGNLDQIKNHDLLKGWFDFENGEFVAKKHREFKSQDDFVKFIKQLNDFGNTLGKDYGNVFKYNDTTGDLDVDFSRFIGLTTANQFNGYKYGTPDSKKDSKVMRADYRWKGAVKRTLGMAAQASGSKMDALYSALDASMQGDAVDQFAANKQKRLSEEFERNRQRTAKTRAKTWRAAANDLLLAYGDLGEGYQALELDANGNLKALEPGKKGYIDLSKEYGEIVGRERNGNISKDSYIGSMINMIDRARESSYFKDGSMYLLPQFKNGQSGFRIGDGTNEFIGQALALTPVLKDMFSDKAGDGRGRYDKESDSYRYSELDSNISRLLEAEKSYQAALKQYESTFDDEDKKAFEEQKEELEMAILDYQAVTHDLINNKNGSIFQMQYNRLGHSAMLSAQSQALPFYNNGVKNVDQLFEGSNRTSATAFTHINHLKQMLKKGSEESDADHLKSLLMQLEYMYGKDYKNVLKGYNLDYNDAKGLEKFVLGSVSVGSDIYKTRLKNLKDGEKLRGLFGLFGRFPFSEGQDSKYSEILAGDSNHGNIDEGEIRVDLGLGKSVNADFDGDKLVFHLASASGAFGSKYSGKNKGNLIDQMQSAVKFQDAINQTVAMAEFMDVVGFDPAQGKSAGLARSMSKDDIAKMFDMRAQDAAALASRINKSKTGQLSNLYQTVVESMTDVNPEDIAGANESQKQTFMNQMLVRGFFSTFTQDAISSKKVFARMAGKYGYQGEDANFLNDIEYLKDFNILDGLLKNPKNYESEAGLKRITDQAQRMGILGADDKGLFSGRLSSTILAYGQNMFAGAGKNFEGENDRNFLAFANALGITDEARRKQLYNSRFIYNKDTGELDTSGFFNGQQSLFNLNSSELRNILTKYQEQSGSNIGWTLINKNKYLPGAVSAINNPLYHIGNKVIEEGTEEADNLAEHLKNPQNGYDSLATSATNAKSAIEAEAAAEKAKIAIAGQEGKAITGLSKDYEALGRQLEKTKNIQDAYFEGNHRSASVSTINERIFGSSFPETLEFDRAIDKYLKENKDFSNLKTSKDIALALGYSEKNIGEFETARGSKSAAMFGTIADTIEEVITEYAKLEAKRGHKFTGHNVNFEKILADADMQDFLNFNDGRKKGYKALMGSGEGQGNYENILRLLYGDEYSKYFDRAFGAGAAFFRQNLHLAGGNINNLGESEGYGFNVYGSNKASHGYFDRVIYGQYPLYNFNEGQSQLRDAIFVADKKNARSLSDGYIFQGMQYARAMERIRDEILDDKGFNPAAWVDDKEGTGYRKTAYDAFFGTQLGSKYSSNQADKNYLSYERFQKIIGVQGLGAAIVPLINWVNSKTGVASVKKIGNLVTDTKGRSKLSWTSNANTDAQIDSYLAKGTPFADWDAGAQQAFKNSMVDYLGVNDTAFEVEKEKAKSGKKGKGKSANSKDSVFKGLKDSYNELSKAYDEYLKVSEQMQEVMDKGIEEDSEEYKKKADWLKTAQASLENSETKYLKAKEKAYKTDKNGRRRYKFGDDEEKYFLDDVNGLIQYIGSGAGSEPFAASTAKYDSKYNRFLQIQANTQERARLQKEREIQGLFKQRADISYKLWENEQKLAKNKDDSKLPYFDIVKKEFTQQQKANDLEIENQRLQYGELMGDLFKNAESDSNRKFELSKAQYMVKQRETKEYQKKNSPGFLGFDAYTMRWVERMVSGGLIMTFFARAKRGLTDLANKAKQLDKAMANLRIVTGQNADNARIMIDNYAKLGKELGATALEVTQAATGWFNNLSRSPINKLL